MVFLPVNFFGFVRPHLLRRPRAFSLHVNRQIMRYIGRADEVWRKYLFYESDGHSELCVRE